LDSSGYALINLHVYPSPITNESRIEREVATISSLGIFTSVEVAGIAAPGLADAAPLGEQGRVRRFAYEAGSRGLLARAGKTFAFGRAVLQHYSSQPLSVINCHSVAALPACVALKRSTGARLVYDTHELETEASAAVGLRKPIYKVAERRGIRQVDHTFTVSESIEGWYREAYGLTKVDTIYNYPSRAQAGGPADKQYFRRMFGLPDSARVYLYQGVLGAGRGLEMVARAFTESLVPDGVVIFLGYGPLESEVRRWAAASSRVFFHAAVPPGELGSVTGAGDVGLAPTIGAQCLSYYYSAPNKMFQYWHAGIPVVASRLPEHERFLSRYPAGTLTDSDSMESFVKACRVLEAQDPDVISSGIAKARDELCWETYTDLFKRRYERLAGCTGREVE
jgi:glycosyltransferase involved in cell wall biosynthesis